MSGGDGPRPPAAGAQRSSRRRRPGPTDGTPSVFAADEQAAAPVELDALSALAEQVLLAEGVRGDCELALYFVDEATIADLNQRFLGVEGPTDVLAFPIDDDIDAGGRMPDAGTTGPDRNPAEPSDLPVLLGDVVVCPAVAARNVEGGPPDDDRTWHAGTYPDELALLVVHGILHVLGMDHAEPDDRAAMQARERELLGRFHGPAS